MRKCFHSKPQLKRVPMLTLENQNVAYIHHNQCYIFNKLLTGCAAMAMARPFSRFSYLRLDFFKIVKVGNNFNVYPPCHLTKEEITLKHSLNVSLKNLLG